MKKIIALLFILCFSFLIFGCSNLNLEKYWREVKFTDIKTKTEFNDKDNIPGDFSAPEKIGSATLSYSVFNKNITVDKNIFKISPIILKDEIIMIEATLSINNLTFNKDYELVLKKTPTYKINIPSECSINNLSNLAYIKLNDNEFYFKKEQTLEIKFTNIENKIVCLNNNDITQKIVNNIFNFTPSSDISEYIFTFKHITFKLTADLEDGEKAALQTEHIKNSEYLLPKASKKGYKFIKWVLKDNPDTEVKKITFDKDYVIKPIFEKGYTLTYDLDGGIVATEIVTEFAPNEKYTLPTPVKDGYNFIKWIDLATNTEITEITFNKDYSIKAIYAEKSLLNISYDYNGGIDSNGNNSKTSDKFEENSLINSLPQLSHPDNTLEFVGWYNREGKITFPYKVVKSETLKAIFKKIIYYTINYDFNGAVDAEGNNTKPSENLRANTIINNLPQLTHPDNTLTFIGWFDSSGKINLPYEVVSNETLRAVFKKEVKVYYALNGGEINGSGNYSDGKTYYVGDTITSIPTPTKTGFNFKEWTIDNNKVVFPYTIPDVSDITFKAEYIKGLDPEIPNGYYDAIEGKDGEDLILALQQILKNMRGISYADVRQALEKTDEDPDNPGYVLGMYDRVHYRNKWTGGDPWNREHVWPNSKLGVGRVKSNQINQASDLHNLRACEKNINSKRNNHHYVNGTGPTGNFSTDKKWYPGDADQGDAARILMYMAVRYYGVLRLKVHEKVVDNPTYQNASANMGDLRVFKKFHESDPVDKFEIHRNKEIYKIQKNRNPFIDRPELFLKVWLFFMKKEGERISTSLSNIYTLNFYKTVLTQYVEIKQY